MPIVLLLFSNVFMTYAWYGHLKDMRAKPLVLVIVLSQGVAFFEYCLQVPANHIGNRFFDLSQLKVLQEIITMVVFAGFCAFYMRHRLTWDYVWASLCLAGAAFFLFRNLPTKRVPAGGSERLPRDVSGSYTFGPPQVRCGPEKTMHAV